MSDKKQWLERIDEALDSVDGHSYEYSSLTEGARYLAQYRMLINQKFDEVIALLEECDDDEEYDA